MPEEATPPRMPARADARLRQAELIISHVLRGGVLTSAAIIALGVVLFYVRATSGTVSDVVPRSLGDVVGGLPRGEPLAVVALGLVLLLVTPVLRVAVSIVTFALERDWLYTGITVLVLLILLVSFLLGKGGA